MSRDLRTVIGAGASTTGFALFAACRSIEIGWYTAAVVSYVVAAVGVAMVGLGAALAMRP